MPKRVCIQVANSATRPNALLLPMRYVQGAMKRYLRIAREALLRALAHDVINTSKAVAYSSMLMLFPALLVITTLVAQVQEGSTMLGELRSLFDQFLPADTLDLLQSYVLTRRLYSSQLLFSAGALSIFAGLGVMLSLMEGFRRAYNLPQESWGFWDRRLRGILLVAHCDGSSLSRHTGGCIRTSD